MRGGFIDVERPISKSNGLPVGRDHDPSATR